MRTHPLFRVLFTILTLAISFSLQAGIGDIYPIGSPSAKEIISQVWYVNHFRATDRFGILKKPNNVTYLVYRNSKGKYRIRTLERYLKNNFPKDGKVQSKDIAIFHYPTTVRGTGFLITDYVKQGKNQDLRIWLPALRKIRRFSQPNHDDAYAGSDWTFGDVSLRKPYHETHKLLREEKFSAAAEGGGKLHVIAIPNSQQKDFMTFFPQGTNEFQDRDCYVVKSTTKFREFWYDYRISWIDKETFADYRTLSYKNGKLVKIIDRNWQPMRNHPPSPDLSDPRAVYWIMWYGKNYKTGHESMAVIPSVVVEWNTDISDTIWTEKYLRRTHR